MNFKCLASNKEHVNNISLVTNQPLTLSEKFKVEYPPVGLAPFDEAQKSGNQVEITAVRGKQGSINIEFEAEPPPRIDQIKWHIVRDTADLSLIIFPEQTVHRMSASVPIVSNQRFEDASSTTKNMAQLIIYDVRPEDQDDFFYLEVDNAHGKEEFRFSLNVVDVDPSINNYSYYDAYSSSSAEKTTMSSLVNKAALIFIFQLLFILHSLCLY